GVREFADLVLAELRKGIPAFLTRVDLAERGVMWRDYLRDTRRATVAATGRALAGERSEPRPEVVLTDFDPEGEVKVVAAAMYAARSLAGDQLLDVVRKMTAH